MLTTTTTQLLANSKDLSGKLKWKPAEISAEQGLVRLTSEEKELIFRQLPRTNNEIYADAVFEGGGVKGIAFLGALRCCSDLGIKWKKLAGTSAGAITAALVAADFTIEQLEAAIGGLNFMDFLSQKTSPLILNGDPKDDLDNPLWMIGNLQAAGKRGEYSTEPFKAWLDDTLGDIKTFNHVQNKGHELKIIVSDISQGQMLVLPDDVITASSPEDLKSQEEFLPKLLALPENKALSVAEAVRLSMSIPFFFEPGTLGKSTIVDGGILSNFPLWIYDVDSKDGKPPAWPTFGFRLTNQQKPKLSMNVNNAASLNTMEMFMQIMHTMNVASDRYHLRKSEDNRVIELNDNGIKATQFNLTNDDKTRLYVDGYNNTRNFFLKKWDWNQHLRLRGFQPEMQSL
jgi:NTE family protein